MELGFVIMRSSFRNFSRMLDMLMLIKQQMYYVPSGPRAGSR
jgi:hypothetical protein